MLHYVVLGYGLQAEGGCLGVSDYAHSRTERVGAEVCLPRSRDHVRVASAFITNTYKIEPYSQIGSQRQENFLGHCKLLKIQGVRGNVGHRTAHQWTQ